MVGAITNVRTYLSRADIRMKSPAQRVAVEVIAFGVVLLSTEAAIRAFRPETVISDMETRKELISQRTARKLDVDFDSRSLLEVVTDLRRRGIEAFPGVSREWPRSPNVRKFLPPNLYPLS